MENELKVFKLNDYDWVCAKSLDEAIDYYIDETGITEEDALDNEKECDLDKEGMWVETSDYNGEIIKNDEVLRNPQFGDYTMWYGRLHKYTSFRETIKNELEKYPDLKAFVIASTEC